MIYKYKKDGERINECSNVTTMPNSFFFFLYVLSFSYLGING